MTAVPADIAVTSPPDDTVATDVSSEVQFTLLLVAVVGYTLALSWDVSPTPKESDDLFNVMLDTYTVADSTNTLQVAYFPLPSAARQVMVAVPADLADICP